MMPALSPAGPYLPGELVGSFWGRKIPLPMEVGSQLLLLLLLTLSLSLLLLLVVVVVVVVVVVGL